MSINDTKHERKDVTFFLEEKRREMDANRQESDKVQEVVEKLVLRLEEALEENRRHREELLQRMEGLKEDTGKMRDTSEQLSRFVPFVGKLEQLFTSLNPMRLFGVVQMEQIGDVEVEMDE